MKSIFPKDRHGYLFTLNKNYLDNSPYFLHLMTFSRNNVLCLRMLLNVEISPRVWTVARTAAFQEINFNHQKDGRNVSKSDQTFTEEPI